MFEENGGKLRFAAHKKIQITLILATPYEPISSEEYLSRLWAGAELPTDNSSNAIEVIQSTITLLESNGEEVNVPELLELDIQDLSQIRFSLEDNWFKVLEGRYARNQVSEWAEILEYLRALTLPICGRGLIPQGEGPAYFEWALWRAFLAINSLSNKPWEARRFRVDEEFYLLGPAPGGGPDLIFEFNEFVVIVEVTLTSNSRQEAAEGEPVRRHVANMSTHYSRVGKPVFGLFIANTIDTNTAETFRLGTWYRADDSRKSLDIVPITLTQFADIFEAGFSAGRSHLDYQHFSQLFSECRAESSSKSALEWKGFI